VLAQPLTFQQNCVSAKSIQQNGSQTYIMFQQIMFRQKAKRVFQQKVLTVLQVGQFFPHNGYEGRHAG
jgi:hypothetical protein